MPIGFRATGIDVLTPQSRKLPVIDRPQALRFVLKVLIACRGLVLVLVDYRLAQWLT